MGESYIHNYARTLAGQLGIVVANYRRNASMHLVVEMLVRVRWNAIWNHIRGESKATIARLAFEGLGNFDEIPESRVKMADVHRDQNGNVLDWMHPDWSGPNMVRQVATTAVVAAMAENIWAEVQKLQARDAAAEHYSEFRDEIQAARFGRDAEGYGQHQSQK